MMADATILFEAAMHFTGNVEYGFSMADAAGGAAIPTQGARFDVTFEGEVGGPRLKGIITGTDYVLLTATGGSQLYIRSRITTEDGHHIAVTAEGMAVPRAGSALADLSEAMTFSTAAPSYTWLNDVRAEGTGVVDSQTGQIKLTVRSV